VGHVDGAPMGATDPVTLQYPAVQVDITEDVIRNEANGEKHCQNDDQF